MFNESHSVRVPVALTLTNGEKLQGVMLLGRVQKLFDVLNKAEPFIEFETREGRQLVISKNSILNAAQLDDRKGRTGNELLRRPQRFDPHDVLGIARDAPDEAIRPAYLSKARQYHPDQFAANPLPPEVIDYLEAMFVMVQRAYGELSSRGEKGVA